MDSYRITKNRYMELRSLCKKQGFEETVREALGNDLYYGLEEWIFIHVTEPRKRRSNFYTLQAEGLPCACDTFRLYRAKFYYNLELIVYGNHVDPYQIKP